MVVNTQSKLTKNFPANRYFKKSGIQSSPNPSFNPDAASASQRPTLPRRYGSAG